MLKVFLKFRFYIKRLIAAVFILQFSTVLIFSSVTVAYADETTNSNSSSNNNDSALGNVTAGQSLFDALSRIYGNSTNNNGTGTNNGTDANNGDNNGNGTSNGTGIFNGNGTSNGNGTNNYSNANQVSVQDQIMQGMETQVKGPSVDDGGLSEYYHQNYKVYEESLNEDVSVFTNVPNGSVVNRPVVLDIPEGVAARMKKDGKTVSVESEEPITEPGSYVLTLYVQSEDQDHVPFSAQKISKAKFRFRIQYKTGVAGYDAIEEDSSSNSGLPGSSLVSGFGLSGSSSSSQVSGNDAQGTENPSLLFGEEDGNTLPDDLRPDDYDFSQGAETENTEDATQSAPEEENPEPGQKGGGFLAVNGMTGEYDDASGYYKNTLITKDFFFTNVPNGMLTNEPVMIQAADNLEYLVYKDGAQLENYEGGQYLRDDGSYTVFVTGKTPAFESAYGDRPPVFHFRIIKNPVSDLGVLNAPENMTFRSVRYEGTDINDRALIGAHTVRLIDDGSYEITMDSPQGSTELMLSLDTLQPFFDVNVKPNLGTVSYRTQDLDHVELYRNGQLVNDAGTVREITDPGEYTLTAYDRAGNSSTATFRVSYRINGGAVVAILIAVGLIGGLVYYLLRIRKKVMIR